MSLCGLEAVGLQKFLRVLVGLINQVKGLLRGMGGVQTVHKKFQNKLVTSKLRLTGRWTCKQWGLGGGRERLQSGWLTTGLLNYTFVFL